MKNNLAENMIRFGAKNLTSNNIKKLEQLVEQPFIEDDPSLFTVPGTSVNFIIDNGPTARPGSGTKKTIYARFSPLGAPPRDIFGALSFNSPVMRDTRMNRYLVTITKDDVIFNNRNIDAGTIISVDVIYYITRTLFNESPTQQNVVETIKGLMYARDQINLDPSPAAQMLSANITKILRVVFTIARMDYTQYLPLDRKHGGYIDDRGATMVYNAARTILGLPVENAKINADPAYREKLQQQNKSNQNNKPA